MTAKPTETLPFAGTAYLPNGQKLISATARLQAQTFRGAMRYQIEMLNFLRHRYEQDVKLVDDLVASDEFNDAFDVVTDFMQNAATEYTSEAGKMASISSKLSSETARRMRRQADEMIEDLAAKTVA